MQINIYRSGSAIDASNVVTQMVRAEPVENWEAILDNLGLPNYYMTFSGIICTVLTVTFDDEQVDSLVDRLLTLFSIPEDIYDFIVNVYLPEVY